MHWKTKSYTTGDRFEAAEEINDLFEQKSPAGQLYVTLKENGFHPERDWPLREHGVTYRVDLALPAGNNNWLPVLFSPSQTSTPSNCLYLQPDQDISDCLRAIQQKLHEMRRA